MRWITAVALVNTSESHVVEPHGVSGKVNNVGCCAIDGTAATVTDQPAADQPAPEDAGSEPAEEDRVGLEGGA